MLQPWWKDTFYLYEIFQSGPWASHSCRLNFTLMLFKKFLIALLRMGNITSVCEKDIIFPYSVFQQFLHKRERTSYNHRNSHVVEWRIMDENYLSFLSSTLVLLEKGINLIPLFILTSVHCWRSECGEEMENVKNLLCNGKLDRKGIIRAEIVFSLASH